MRLLLKLKWSKGDDKWHLLNPANDKFVYDLFDCENFTRIFEHPDKSKIQMYVIDVYKYEGRIKKNKELQEL